MKDAGIGAQPENAENIGVCIGSGIGGLPMIEDTHQAALQGGARKISPFFIPGSIINDVSGLFSILYGLKGPNFATVSACATGNHAIGEAQRLIEYGDADVMVAGVARGIAIAMASCSAKAPACWSSKSMSTRRSVARKSTRNSLVTA